MTGETNLQKLLASMMPQLLAGTYVFATLARMRRRRRGSIPSCSFASMKA